MKELLAWIKLYPLKAVVIAALALASGCVIASGRPLVGLALLTVTYVLWAFEFLLDMKLLLCLLLAAPCAQAQKKEAPALIVGGVVIIGIAGTGYIGYRAYKACKRIAKKREAQATNAEPQSFGAAFSYATPGSCEAERLLSSPPVTFTLTIALGETNCVTSIEALAGEEYSQSFWEFQEEMSGQGLALSSLGRLSSYARAGHACRADEMPVAVSMDWDTGVVRVGDGGVTVSVEASRDCVEWVAMLTTEVPRGSVLEVSDVSRAQACFYRVRLNEP